MNLKSGNAAGKYLLAIKPNGQDAKDFYPYRPITAADEATLLVYAKTDASRFLYNGVISFIGGLQDLVAQQMGWATTKMYYSSFYIARAVLCRENFVTFHVPKERGSDGHTQCELRILPGECVKIVSKPPSTHKLVAKRFLEIGYPSFMGGLTIESLDPMKWLMDQREFWQYRAARFPDPDAPSIFAHAYPERLPQLLAAYRSDKKGVYLADPEHAVIALPFRLIIWALSKHALLCPGVVDDEDIRYIHGRCRIGGRLLTEVSAFCRR